MKLKQVPAVDIESRKVVFNKTDSVEVLGAWVGYDATRKEVFLNRMNNMFPSIERAPAQAIDGKVSLDIYVDKSIIEVFINNGEAVITDQVFTSH